MRRRRWWSRWLLAVLLALALPARADDLAEARRLLDAREFAPALAAYDRAVAARPDDAELAIERARALGFADRNADAAQAYALVARRFPEWRTQIRRAWGWQALWSADTATAAALFAEAVAQDPTDADARRGLAQALLWSDRPLAAARQFEQLLPTQDEGLALQAARAYHWAGFPERALPLLAGSSLPEARHLRDYRVARERRPYLSGALDWSDDADDLRTFAATAAAGWRLAEGDTAELSVRANRLEGPDTSEPGNPRYSVEGQEALLAWSGRWGSVASTRGAAWPSIAAGVRRYDGWSQFAWRASARYVPRDDGLAAWAYAGNGVIETVGAVRNEVGYVEGSAGVEGRPSPRWLFAGSLTQLGFDRGNDRTRGTLRAEYLLVPARRLRLGAEAVLFDDSEPTGPGRPSLGYWSPDRYSEQRLYASMSVERGAWALDGRASAGYYRERDGWGTDSSGPTYAAELVVARDLSPSARVKLYAGGTQSGAGLGSGGSGYHRVYGGLSLTSYFK